MPDIVRRVAKIVTVAQMRQENVVFMLKTGPLDVGMGFACKIASRRGCLLIGETEMLFNVTVTIPAYDVDEIYQRKFAHANAALEDAMDEVALYWINHNGGDDLDIAREKCDVEFSIKIKPVP